MSIAGALVDAVFAAIRGGVALTEDDREKAKAAVNRVLGQVAEADPGPLKPRADAIRARYAAQPADEIPVERVVRDAMRPAPIPAGFGLRDTVPPSDDEDGA